MLATNFLKERKVLGVLAVLLFLLLILFGWLYRISSQEREMALKSSSQSVLTKLRTYHDKEGIQVKSQLEETDESLTIKSRLLQGDAELRRFFEEHQKSDRERGLNSSSKPLYSYRYKRQETVLSGIQKLSLHKETYLPDKGYYRLTDQPVFTVASAYQTADGKPFTLQDLIKDQSAFEALVSTQLANQKIDHKQLEQCLSLLQEQGLNLSFEAGKDRLFLNFGTSLPELELAYQDLYTIMETSYLTGKLRQLIKPIWQKKQKRSRPLRSESKTPGKYVALTFDDGPDKTKTSQVLEILDRYDVKATFFLVGKNIAGNESLVKQMATDGHQLGNHSWSHPDLTSLSPEALREEIDRTQEAIFQASGVRPTILRPPYGSYNQTVASAGLPLVNWTIDTMDWQNRSTEAILSQIKAQLHEGGIILMHDIHQTSVDALPAVIDYLKAQGYQLVTVEELHKLSNS